MFCKLPPPDNIRLPLLDWIRIRDTQVRICLSSLLRGLQCYYLHSHPSHQHTTLPPSHRPVLAALAARGGRPLTPQHNLSSQPTLHRLPTSLLPHNLHLHSLHPHSLHFHNLHLHSLHLHSLHLHSLHPPGLHFLTLRTPHQLPGGKKWPSRPSSPSAVVFLLPWQPTSFNFAASLPEPLSWPWRPETGLR